MQVSVNENPSGLQGEKSDTINDPKANTAESTPAEDRDAKVSVSNEMQANTADGITAEINQSGDRKDNEEEIKSDEKASTKRVADANEDEEPLSKKTSPEKM